MHQPGEVDTLEQVGLPWRDNAFFAWWDHHRSVYGIVHVSTSLNGGGLRARCALRIGDRDREIVEDLSVGTFDSASIRVRLDGRILVEHHAMGLDLIMTPMFATVDFTTNRSVPSLTEEFPVHHYQRGFHAEGTATLGGERRDFSGVGWRDRTWGYRNESAQWVEYFYANFVMPDCAIGLWKALGADGKKRAFAWRVDDHGQATLGDFTFARDGAGLFSDAAIDLGGQTACFEKIETTAGWWLPMGARQTGPTFAAWDEWFTVRTGDGDVVGALGEYGCLRQVLGCVPA
ncbi:hypothetical protein [Mycobacterium sp.]|uniref:hypothetical protein n=1 Tax=Mycobacterium sp. TaxID=1785 RepID=UPI00120D0206|nr:hypothetical protein [Mycobacterium sp.]TAM62840.1 MAG: hypothetical protein EPN51_28800 [Mycobacterium sp.]